MWSILNIYNVFKAVMIFFLSPLPINCLSSTAMHVIAAENVVKCTIPKSKWLVQDRL